MEVKLQFVYNNDSLILAQDLMAYAKEINLDIQGYSEELYREKNKAFKLKGGYSARKTPFALITVDGEPIKAYYSEVDECTFSNIKNGLESIIKDE